MASSSSSSSTSSAVTLPPSAQQILFARAVMATFALWPTMRLAIAHEWGGADSQDKCDFIVSHLCDLYGGPSGSSTLGSFEPTSDSASTSASPITAPETPDQDDIAEILEGYMADEFDTRIEDESCDELAGKIVALHKVIFATPATQDPAAAQQVLEQGSAAVAGLEESVGKLKGKKLPDVEVQQADDDDGESEDESEGDDHAHSMDVDEPASEKRTTKVEPVVDDDGFTLVQKKR